MPVHLFGECYDALAQIFCEFRELCVLLDEDHQLGGLLGGETHPFFIVDGEGFTVLGIGLGMGFVAIRLPGLRQQNQRGGVGGLKTECQVQKNKGIQIKTEDSDDIQDNPDGDDHSLAYQKKRGAKKTGEGFGLQGKPIITEDSRQVLMGEMKTVMMPSIRLGVFMGHSVNRIKAG